MSRPAVVLLLLLAACTRSSTVIIVSVPHGDGSQIPVASQELVLLPYDRDSVIAGLTAPFAASRPDTLPLVRLLDSLKLAYQRYLAVPTRERPAARPALDAVLAGAEGRLTTLRASQHAWRDSAFRSYDSITFALTKRLARDPFADTTDARGLVRVTPSRSGPWWVTVTAWDAADPNAEWYWNQPLVGDTLYLSAANARHRRRF